MGPGTEGTTSLLSAALATAVRAVMALTPTVLDMKSVTPIPMRAMVSTLLQRLATASATFSRPSVFSRWRNDLISVPVLIDTGQGSAHVPSAAHVCIPSYSYSLSSCANICESLGWRAISRRTTMRWRGVMVTLRDGQTGSHMPHSMQRVASEPSIAGEDLNPCRWIPSLRLRTQSGASTPYGSANLLIRHIISVALSPHSRRTNGAILRPVPCSALSEPSYLSITSSTNSSMNAL